MKHYLKQIGIAVLTSAIVFVVGVNIPIHYFNFSKAKLGATVTTLTSTDNLSDFPTTYNANLNAINTDLEAVEATTTMTLLTSAPNLATIGTITSGTWTGSTIGVANGGTGATSLNQYSLLFGSSTNAIYALTDLGTSGQFLTSGGAGVLPSWTTAAIDQALDYTWTGHHIFSSLFATNASSTNATTTNLYANGIVDFGDASAVTIDGLYSTSTVFSANGTWTKPSGAKIVEVFVWGSGGGGGGGERDASNADGGSGGGGGCFIHQVYDAANLSATETVVIGAGGAGGLGEHTTEGSTSGSGGGNSSFSSGGTLSQANGGGGGTGGTQGNTGGTGGTCSPASGSDTPTLFTFNGRSGASAPTMGNDGNAGTGGTSLPNSSASGGSGATTNGVNQAGGAGGDNTYTGFHAAFGFIPQFTATTTDPYTLILNADGGAGGDASATGGGTPGNGEAGKFPGGGGGGGGGKDTDDGAQYAGDGGRGGDGLVIVVTYF